MQHFKRCRSNDNINNYHGCIGMSCVYAFHTLIFYTRRYRHCTDSTCTGLQEFSVADCSVH